MAVITVAKYSLTWMHNSKTGYCTIYNASGLALKTFTVDNLTDLSALGELLRNEKPIYWSDSNEQLRTSREQIGEEET